MLAVAGRGEVAPPVIVSHLQFGGTRAIEPLSDSTYIIVASIKLNLSTVELISAQPTVEQYGQFLPR